MLVSHKCFVHIDGQSQSVLFIVLRLGTKHETETDHGQWPMMSWAKYRMNVIEPYYIDHRKSGDDDFIQSKNRPAEFNFIRRSTVIGKSVVSHYTFNVNNTMVLHCQYGDCSDDERYSDKIA